MAVSTNTRAPTSPFMASAFLTTAWTSMCRPTSERCAHVRYAVVRFYFQLSSIRALLRLRLRLRLLYARRQKGVHMCAMFAYTLYTSPLQPRLSLAHFSHSPLSAPCCLVALPSTHDSARGWSPVSFAGEHGTARASNDEVASLAR